MIFELSNEDIQTALAEYMNSRDIAKGKEFTFVMKTSRKGDKTSRAIITTLDIASPKAVEAIAAPVVVLEPAVVVEIQPEEIATLTQPEEVALAEKMEGEEVKTSPFKKLFAA